MGGTTAEKFIGQMIDKVAEYLYWQIKAKGKENLLGLLMRLQNSWM